jgi:hypothetical protein
MHPTLKLAALATALILAACGGGSDDEPDAGGDGGGGGGALSCNFPNYQAGAVSVATSADLAAYAGTFDGAEGSFDSGGAFVKSADATMVLGSSGTVTYKGAALTITSFCVDNTAGPFGKLLYLEFAGGKFDVSTTDAGTDLRWAWGVAPGGAFFRNGVKR